MEGACSHFKEELKYTQGDCSAINIRQCVETIHGKPKLKGVFYDNGRHQYQNNKELEQLLPVEAKPI